MLKKCKIWMKKINWPMFIIIALITIVYISLIFNDSVWADEAYTMLILKKDFHDIIIETANDVHPPLYYFIAKLFTMLFGYSVSSVKLASILPIILLMIFIANKFHTTFQPVEKVGRNGCYISILLISLCPRAFFMNIELRMYTWAMFFVTCSSIYAYELYKDPSHKKTLFLFILTSLCAAYTHYYAAVSEVFIYLFLMITLLLKSKKNLKLCLIVILITIIGYIPWIPVLIKQFIAVKQEFHIGAINMRKHNSDIYNICLMANLKIYFYF